MNVDKWDTNKIVKLGKNVTNFTNKNLIRLSNQEHSVLDQSNRKSWYDHSNQANMISK